MYSDNGIHYKPILAFLSFGPRSVLATLQAEDGFTARRHCRGAKSTRGNGPKGIQKSGKKSAYIPYLDNIEITSIKIFNKTTEKSDKSSIFSLNGLLSLFDSTLSCDRIVKVIYQGVRYLRERGSLLRENQLERIIIDYR